jgi:hypothetical protein
VSYIRVRLIRRRVSPRPLLIPPLRDACSLFERFHRYAPDLVARSSCRRTIPEVLVKIGKLRGLIYSSDKGERGCPKSYIHFMEDEPLLACDANGTQLYILGGNYQVTRRGIEG